MLPLTWVLLTRYLYPPGPLSGDAASIIEGERASLGPMSKGEKITGAVFALTALAWVMRSEKTIGGDHSRASGSIRVRVGARSLGEIAEQIISEF